MLLSKIAFMHCVSFSNILFVSGSFMNKLGYVYVSSAPVSRFASVIEIIKYVQLVMLLLLDCLVFSRTSCKMVLVAKGECV